MKSQQTKKNMRFFKRKNRILDLTENYKKQQSNVGTSISPTEQTLTGDSFIFPAGFGANTNQSETNQDSGAYIDTGTSIENRRKKLAKRLIDMTSRMEDLSNQIYHMQQRIEVLEKKMNAGSY